MSENGARSSKVVEWTSVIKIAPVDAAHQGRMWRNWTWKTDQLQFEVDDSTVIINWKWLFVNGGEWNIPISTMTYLPKRDKCRICSEVMFESNGTSLEQMCCIEICNEFSFHFHDLGNLPVLLNILRTFSTPSLQQSQHLQFVHCTTFIRGNF